LRSSELVPNQELP